MSKVKGSGNELVKSQKIVSKAVGVFSQAITEVEKANELLRKGIESDSMQITVLKNQIRDLNDKITDLEKAKGDKGQEIRNNEHLLASLRQFTKED